MSLLPPDDIDILDLDDLERGGPGPRRRPRQTAPTPAGRTGGSWADPRFLVPLLLFLTAVFVIGMAIRSGQVSTTDDAAPEESTVAPLSDLAIAVRDAELRAGFDGLEITEEDGTVIITGTAPDAVVAASIGAVARSVEGTQRVDNRVVIAGSSLEVGVTEPAAVATSGGLSQQLAEVGQVTFETGSSALTPEGSIVVDSVAALLTRSPGVRIEVHGHTDSDGDETRNEVLSQERAEAVVVALGQRGIDTARLTAVGFGESNPIAPNITADGRATNRRIEFVVSG